VSTTTDFVAELVRAANMVEKIGDDERGRLLDRAWRTILDGRQRVGMTPSRTRADKAIDILSMSKSIGLYLDDQMKAALLEAASMIRDLKIILDAKDEVTGGGATH